MKTINMIESKDSDYYYSEEGLLVFTERHHLKRGYCCNNNCRHCPYKLESENLVKSNGANGSDSVYQKTGDNKDQQA